MATDFHAHYVPPPVVAFLRARRVAPCIETLPDGSERLVMPVGILGFGRAYTDIDARLASMDEIGVRRQVLSLPGLFGIDSLPLDESGSPTRAFNEDVAAVCRRHPDRFLGLAALPLADMDVAIAELRQARTELGLIGAILPNNAFTSLAEAGKMRPLFAVAEEMGAHFFIHPGRRPDEALRSLACDGASREPDPDNALLRRALEVQAEVSEAMITLLFTDFLDRYPNVSIHVANLGGTLPAVIERMDHTVRTRAPGTTLPSERVRRVTVDCASLGPHTLELAVAIYGAERIVFGTDCPIFRVDWTLAAVRQARLAEADRAAILSGNAERLLDRFRVPQGSPPQAASSC
ncbi:MAG: amidohydrolase [Betaproteobacteria bacterium]|nr:MAG: amidohydrolase [Betaproteobacteria bacterium]